MKKIILVSIVASLMSFSAFAASQEATVSIKGMMCSSCAKHVQSELLKSDTVSSVKVDRKKGTVNIAFKDGKDMSDDQIKSLVQAAGDEYTVGSIVRK
jgi:copper chaperone CopZ